MAINLEQREESNVIRLDGLIDIALAAELKATLLEALKSGKPLLVSLNADADLDVTAIQLLWAAKREAKASNLSLLLERPVPDAIFTALTEAGFERFPVPLYAERCNNS